MDWIDEKGMNSQIVQMSSQSGIPVPKKANAFPVNLLGDLLTIDVYIVLKLDFQFLTFDVQERSS